MNGHAAIRSQGVAVDPRAWLAWAIAAAAVASLTRNPLYLLVLVLEVAVVGASWALRGRRRAAPLSIWRFALVVVPLAGVMNGLMVHAGDTVLARLPNWMPVVGGVVTAEGILYGASSGLALTALFGAFSTLTQVVPLDGLVRLTPRAFREAGLVISIALAFWPQMSRTVERVRQAQAIRGHRVRGVRDWLPILLPVVISGLEGGIALGEAMVARGYGAVSRRQQGGRVRFGLAAGLLGLLTGWMVRAFVEDAAVTGLAVMVVAGGFVVGVLWGAGLHVRHTQYRPRRWRRWDTLVVAGCAMTLLALLAPLSLEARATLSYYPYPRIGLPGFDPLVGLGLLGLLIPALTSASKVR